MKEKKILFITSEYPPKNSPTALAASFVIDYLSNYNQVFCLIINSDENTEKKGNVSIVPLKRKINLSFGSGFIAKLLFRIRQIVLIPFYPVLYPLKQIRINKKAEEICITNNIDIIVCVSFPFESVIAGAYVKRILPRVKFIPYLIDAYACGTLPKYLPKKYSFSRKIEYEKKHIINSDLVIAMESSKDFYEKNKYINKISFLNPSFFANNLVKNGTKNDIKVRQNRKITIVYSGYLYLPDRDPEYIIQVLSKICEYSFDLIFVGKKEKNIILKNEKEKSNVNIISIGHISHNELRDYLKNADCFLHLGVQNKNAISGKIFEYIGYGKPIISIFFNENEATLPYLNKYPLSCCINKSITTVEQAASIIRRFLKKTDNQIVDQMEMLNLFYTSTPKAFEDLLDTLLEDNA